MTFVHNGVGFGEEGNVVGVPYVGLRFPGLGFLTGSDVKDVEVVCASFAGGVFLMKSSVGQGSSDVVSFQDTN